MPCTAGSPGFLRRRSSGAFATTSSASNRPLSISTGASTSGCSHLTAHRGADPQDVASFWSLHLALRCCCFRFLRNDGSGRPSHVAPSCDTAPSSRAVHKVNHQGGTPRTWLAFHPLAGLGRAIHRLWWPGSGLSLAARDSPPHSRRALHDTCKETICSARCCCPA